MKISISILLIPFVIIGIYLLSGIGSKKAYAVETIASRGGNIMMGSMMKNKGSMINNRGHEMFPQYKGVETGYALFRYEGCIVCHAINGQGGIMGPDLSHMGSIKNFSWIAVQIADPSAHFREGSVVTFNGIKYPAIMPNFKGMSSKNIGILSKYLESLK
ncbi:c-type cytochrome [Candidatus Acidulodesulfobacterium sp. H_13]|uniref:c-type cytochrome n=1 Tax=Candidatus Acidulodesulfobacterium sp. H_13 TaxID=3395470 RepID=UPI003AF4B285